MPANREDMGASASRPGSREPSPSVSAASGFDPSRITGNLSDGIITELARAAGHPDPWIGEIEVGHPDHRFILGGENDPSPDRRRWGELGRACRADYLAGAPITALCAKYNWGPHTIKRALRIVGCPMRGRSAVSKVEREGYNFSEVTAIFMRANDIPVHRTIAAAGAIKYLQRQGVVPRAATGRGIPASYFDKDVLQILFAGELQNAGLTPIQIKPIIEEHWLSFAAAARDGRDYSFKIPTANGRFIKLVVSAAKVTDAAGCDFSCDSDRSGEASETSTQIEGSTEGESAGRQASPNNGGRHAI